MIEPKVIAWVGGEHRFALYLGQWRALQEATDAGPQQLLRRLQDGSWRIDDLTHSLRLGLIGGGMDGEAARRLVATMMDLHPLIVFRGTALEVLTRGLTGPAGDPPGEPQGVEDVPAPENGAGPTS